MGLPWAGREEEGVVRSAWHSRFVVSRRWPGGTIPLSGGKSLETPRVANERKGDPLVGDFVSGLVHLASINQYFSSFFEAIRIREDLFICFCGPR